MLESIRERKKTRVVERSGIFRVWMSLVPRPRTGRRLRSVVDFWFLVGFRSEWGFLFFALVSGFESKGFADRRGCSSGK